MCELSPVTFHGDTIFCLTHENQPYTPAKPIVENLGLGWASQSQKLNSNKARWGVTIIVIPSESGDQQMLCLPVRKLPAYLASINPKKVRPELRAKIELYQAESDDALWNYWMNGRAERPAPAPESAEERKRRLARERLRRHRERKREQLTLSAPKKDRFEAYIEQVEAFRAGSCAEIHRLWREGMALVDLNKIGVNGFIGFSRILQSWLEVVTVSTVSLIEWDGMEGAIERSPFCFLREMEKMLSGHPRG